ncbi:MAG: acyltransferase domain-containing protein [Lachnospiraceae bacterium]|nr:acyltransferase domain-containing protein [Lachnospiraceae bacterium]
MELTTFCEKIYLPEEAKEIVASILLTEGEYEGYLTLYKEDARLFWDCVLAQKNYRQLFLYLYCRMGCDTYERYREREISDQIFWDTFYDLKLWCDACREEYGEYGIDQYDWFFRHIDLTVFRLGRLEFERMDSEWELDTAYGHVKKGDEIINIHIPGGEKLSMEACLESIEQAFQFWGKEYTYICHSWLLFPKLKEILPEDSNILKFQQLFYVPQVEYREREGEWRIFGKVRRVLPLYPEKTNLQRSAKKYLLQGNVLGNGIGILKK